MKRLFVFGMLAGLLAFGLTSCSGSDDSRDVDLNKAKDDLERAVDESGAKEEMVRRPVQSLSMQNWTNQMTTRGQKEEPGKEASTPTGYQYSGPGEEGVRLPLSGRTQKQ